MNERSVKYWIDLAEYDLDTAETLYKGGRWLYVAFMCHQTIEKTLKAYWSGTLTTIPPYTHNLKRLADGCGIYNQMDDKQRDFVNTITNYNIQTRYPEDKDELSRTLTPNACRYLIDQTKLLSTWIKQQLTDAKKPSPSSADTSN